ncbi:MBL fold metallo-hydrolase [Fretibacterium sp. OH1220_COT-178]|uniref:MBL fold metallo-hydrolase n=1 Tax=Fretibacterium sp. OH1220_COT-178 TaxID=2491047 RepID=UPI000F5D56A5|nr:MBL fold metallo-hydrolase [Fretibacterium sp. OH1220_COT-178]RRD65887.1 MBL fold metallo-hydrolase [Fretibacterium sp. OH1220_COT-178]
MQYKRFPLGGLWTNGYLFWDEKGRAFFVDPGGEAREVLDFVGDKGLELKAVLLTHGHLDHIVGVRDFLPFVGGEIYISTGDAGMLRHPPEAMQVALRMRCDGVADFHEVSEGMELVVGDLRIEVLETPGHTPGGVCYLIREGDESILVSGDTLFAQSVGRTDLPGGDQAKLDDSLRRLSSLPDALRVLPGHGPETTIGKERRHNPFWPV